MPRALVVDDGKPDGAPQKQQPPPKPPDAFPSTNIVSLPPNIDLSPHFKPPAGLTIPHLNRLIPPFRQQAASRNLTALLSSQIPIFEPPEPSDDPHCLNPKRGAPFISANNLDNFGASFITQNELNTFRDNVTRTIQNDLDAFKHSVAKRIQTAVNENMNIRKNLLEYKNEDNVSHAEVTTGMRIFATSLQALDGLEKELVNPMSHYVRGGKQSGLLGGRDGEMIQQIQPAP
jgi:hypothetical protein